VPTVGRNWQKKTHFEKKKSFSSITLKDSLLIDGLMNDLLILERRDDILKKRAFAENYFFCSYCNSKIDASKLNSTL
jgi:hypothetical protein